MQSDPDSTVAAKCQDDGWLVPASIDATGATCPVLSCSQCGRRVLDFPGKLLATRPDDDAWLDAYDAGTLPDFFRDAPTRFDFRLYICGCRAFPCGKPRKVADLAIDDDLPWYCPGHVHASTDRTE